MKIACAILLLAVAANAQFDRVTSAPGKRCVIGERGRTFEGIIVDNAVEGLCYNADATCAFYTFELNSPWGYLNMEYGVCEDPDSADDCSTLEAQLTPRGYGNFSNCRKTTDESRTFTPTPVDEAECSSRDENDLFITPSCTMRQVLYKMSDCISTYYNNFPYADRDQCKRDVDVVFQCYAQMAGECYSGRCPTVYDEMPGAREFFMAGRDWSFGVNNLDTAVQNLIFSGMVNDTTGYAEFVLESLCPTAPGVEPAWVAMLETFMTDASAWEGVFDEATLALFSAIPCSEKYYDIIGQAYLSAVKGWYAATDKEQVCNAFNEYKANTSTAFLTECDLMAFNADMFSDKLPEEMTPYVENFIRASTIWGEFFWQFNLPGCNRITANYTTSCVSGERIFVDGKIYSDNTVDVLCPSFTNECYKFDYSTELDGVTYRVFGGACVDPIRAYGCDDVRNFTARRGFGEVTTCAVESCYGNYCNDLKATPPTGCMGLIRGDDIQILPSCTAKESMAKFGNCYEQFYKDFPYDTQEQCGRRRTSMMSCLSKVYTECFSGRCPTVLDQIPGVRSSYSTILDLTYNVSSIEEVVERMWAQALVDETTGRQIIEYTNMAFCPDFKDLPTMVEEWFSTFNSTMLAQWLVSMDVDLIELQNTMPCTMKYYTSIAAAYQQMISSFFMAGDKDDMCKAYDVYFQAVTTSYVENCDESKMDDFLYALMPDWLDEAVPYVLKAFEYVGKYFYENPRLPMCSGGHGGNGNPDMINVDCDELYKSTSRCGMKKAWLCDYAKWKADFLGNWLQEYVNYRPMGMTDDLKDLLPTCYKMSDYDGLCRHKNKLECFTIPVQNCPMCYCTDHEYSDLSGLTTFWRNDYRMWQRFFSVYRRDFQNSMGGGSSDSCDA